MKNLVSICIPTYNGEEFLEETLNSIKRQTYQKIEVIISDDQSTDNTLKICEKFKSEVEFPVYIYNHLPSGIGANWNHTVHQSNGEYIKFVFQDDILEDNCVEKMLYYITENNLMAVCSKRSIIDKDGNPVTSGNWYIGCSDLQKSFLNLEFKTFFIFQKKHLKSLKPYTITANIFGEPIAFIFKKQIFNKVGYFNTHYKQILDIEHAYRILKKYPIGIIEEKLFRFRLHENQTTSQNKRKYDLNKEDQLFERFIFQNFYRYLSYITVKIYLRRNYKFFDFLFAQYERNKDRLQKIFTS